MIANRVPVLARAVAPLIQFRAVPSKRYGVYVGEKPVVRLRTNALPAVRIEGVHSAQRMVDVFQRFTVVCDAIKLCQTRESINLLVERNRVQVVVEQRGQHVECAGAVPRAGLSPTDEACSGA